MLRTMHLFAGAGGGLLADLILGHDPIVAVEWEPYACQVLRERAAEGWFPNLRVWQGDVRLFDPSEYEGRVDCIHAGFPCQDISAAGKGAGITGERSGLVREVFRAIDAVQPRFVFLENSPRIRTRGRDYVIGQLVSLGYSWRDGTLAAADVGAWHERKRWWCLAANANGMRELQQKGGVSYKWRRTYHGDKEVADIVRKGCEESSRIAAATESRDIWRLVDMASRKKLVTRGNAWFEAEPDVGRLVYGVADDVVPGAVKALGNGQVPIQAAAAWKFLGGP